MENTSDLVLQFLSVLWQNTDFLPDSIKPYVFGIIVVLMALCFVCSFCCVKRQRLQQHQSFIRFIEDRVYGSKSLQSKRNSPRHCSR